MKQVYRVMVEVDNAELANEVAEAIHECLNGRAEVELSDGTTLNQVLVVPLDQPKADAEFTIEQVEHADNAYARVKTQDGRFVAVWCLGDASGTEDAEPSPITEEQVREMISSFRHAAKFEKLLKAPAIDPNDARVDRK